MTRLEGQAIRRYKSALDKSGCHEIAIGYAVELSLETGVELSQELISSLHVIYEGSNAICRSGLPWCMCLRKEW